MTLDAKEPLEWRAAYPDDRVPWAAPGLKRFWAWLLFNYQTVNLVGIICRHLELAGNQRGLHLTPTDQQPRQRPDLSPDAWSIRLSADYLSGPGGPPGSLGLQVICLASPYPPCGTTVLLDFNDVQFGWQVPAAEMLVAETVIGLWNTLPRVVRGFPQRNYPWEIFPMIRGQWNSRFAIHTATIGEIVLTPGSLFPLRPSDDESFPGRQQLELGISFDDGDAIAWVNWGVALSYYSSGPGSPRHEQALDAFDRALAINPNDDRALTKKGSLFLNPGGDINQAWRLFEQALAINPRNQEACYMRAHVLARLGRKDEALAAFARTADLDTSTRWAALALDNIKGY